MKALKTNLQRLKNTYHFFGSCYANLRYGFPSHRLKVIGVTGTDGKTTTAHLIYHILKSAGKKVSIVSSIYAKIGRKEYSTGFHVTTPSAFALQRLLKLSSDNKDEFFILETTSHALDQKRVAGINYYLGALTNITHEHLDYHQNYHNYLLVKAKLFLKSKIVILNKDDQSFDLIKKIILRKKPLQKIFTYAIKKKADFNWKKTIKTKIFGQYNQYNILASYATCRELGIKENLIEKGIETFTLPSGRLEIIYDKKIKVIIDFAHTPNAIEKVLRTIKKKFLKKKGRLIHIFGSAGLRDHSKRPLMGEASATYSDIVILTEEDYRTEDINKINQQIAIGLEKKGFGKKRKADKYYLTINNRKQAIEQAIKITKRNDVLVFTGKAHEKSLCRGKIEYPYNEKKLVLKILKKYDYL